MLNKIDQIIKELSIDNGYTEYIPQVDISLFMPPTMARLTANRIKEKTNIPFEIGGTDQGNWYTFNIYDHATITIYIKE
jgi:hypothetical protein